MWLSELRIQHCHNSAAAAALIRPLAQECPYAADVAVKKKKIIVGAVKK